MYAAGPGVIATRLMMELSSRRPDSVRILKAVMRQPAKSSDDPKDLPKPTEIELSLFVQKTAESDPVTVVAEFRKAIKEIPGVLDVVQHDVKDNQLVGGSGSEALLTVKLKLDTEFKP